MSNNKPQITPIGLLTALLIIYVLVSLAVPRLREASRAGVSSGLPRVLAVFGGSSSSVGVSGVSAVVGVVGNGVAVTCGACESGASTR